MRAYGKLYSGISEILLSTVDQGTKTRDARRIAEDLQSAGGDLTHFALPDDLVMTTNVLTLTPHDSMVDAARLMRRERIGALPIVDGNRLVGILTRSDVLDAFVALARSVAPEQHGSR